MKLSVARGELLDALSVVGKGLSARSTLPILSGVLLTSSNGEVQLQATDLEVSVKRTCPALVEEEGQIVVPGKLLTEIVRSLPDAAVTIETEGEIAHIRCLHSSFTVKTLNAADFPKFPEVVVEETVSLPSSVIGSVVKKVSKSVSRDETRATLTGILVVVEGPSLRMVSTDSYRLAISEVMMEGEPESGLNVVIPGRALDEITRLASDSEDMKIGLTENQVVFEFGQTVFVTRRIEGNFPNYKQIIPKESATSVEVSGEELIAAVKRVSLMALHNSPIKLQISVEDQTLSLSAMTQDVGEASEDVMVKAEGNDAGIAFNHSFLMDGLSSAGTETVRIEIKDHEKPGLIRSAEEDGFRYVLMPVRTG
jgi:DNA polymerase III subunit beta